MKAETIRLSIDRAMMMDASIQCNCRNKHSFWFVPVAYHPIFKVKMVYGLLISCNVPVETGDVNCDGYINAVDASYILSDYAYAATGQKTFLNTTLADYNSDGAVNAVDASFVLSEYARRSTE